MRIVRLCLTVIFTVLWSTCVGGGIVSGDDTASVDYERDIKPLLKERCFACHGALQQQAELRLDSGELIRRGGDSGEAILPGDAENSLLVERVAEPDESSRMPPEGEPLSAAQIGLLKAWIDQGAVTPQDEQPESDPRLHWAFQQIVRPTPPPAASSSWVRNPIDAFIAREHQRLGLTPAAQADAPQLVRRLYLDLIGLPPPERLLRASDAALDERWYQSLVDQLLEDPRHGERWARHWMDIWRYGDWWGLGNQLRNSQQHIWHWRDWIIESLNADTPYDEMVRLMLAADELAPADLDKLRATGLLARNFFLFNRHQWMDETVEHISKGFLGLTLNCAKCHDHKYDPFVQEDYYRMRAFFEPYHVRLDMIPGEPDLERNAIPRVFDALLDEPTYLFLRGEETQPDKSTIIPPAVPELLDFSPLAIEPVELPAEAWQPQRRPWVRETLLAAAEQAVELAFKTRENAQQDLAAAERLHAEMLAMTEQQRLDSATASVVRTVTQSTAAPKIADDFANFDSQRWQLYGGDWSHEGGRLEQRQDGPTWAALRLLQNAPQDFDLSLRFTIQGGSKWRSVSVGFDDTQDDPAAEANPDDQQQFVYVSAVEGGSKLQAAYRQGGATHYPRDAMRALPIELGRPYTLRVQVRNTLINASLDGVPMLAWQSPLPRRAGAMQITTFDALATFHEVTLEPLAATVQLRQPPATVTSNPTTPQQTLAGVTLAEARLRVAEATLALAEAEHESLRLRFEALALAWELADTAASGVAQQDHQPQPDQDLPRRERQAASAAVNAQRLAAVAGAMCAVAEIELRRLQAKPDQWEAIDKELVTASEKRDSALAMVDAEHSPEESYASVAGAQWSPTRFLSSGADDPPIDFPSHSSGRRRALAQWITDARNPLAARVAVNHIWTRHMGTPLVPTVFDFGRQGSPPTHPDLLDWLAAELIDSGWSMKHIHRLIVTSATYQLSSSVAGREANEAIDRDNRYWWRRSSMRLESQVVRDSILALAGQLDLTHGGPPVRPADQANSSRRSLYFFHSNNDRNLFLTTFDEATVTECYRRQESIVPQQALALTNSRLVLDAIAPIAERLGRDTQTGGVLDDDESFIRLSFLRLLGMAASNEEVLASGKALAAWRGQSDTTPSQARAFFIWALLNHNDFVTLR